MGKIFHFGWVVILSTFLHGCFLLQPQTIAPAAPVNIAEEPEQPTPSAPHTLEIIGGVEPVYFLPMISPILARIDTGAETSSLGVENEKLFEREGEKWVSFDLTGQNPDDKQHFEKKVIRHTSIKRIGDHEERVVVEMNVRFGNEIVNTHFTLADRSKFEYRALIGRNILTGRAIVDTSLSNTFY